MITIIIENASEWGKLRERLKIDKAETFFTFIGEDGNSEGKGLTWFLREGNRYAVRTEKPLYKETVKAKVHDS